MDALWRPTRDCGRSGRSRSQKPILEEGCIYERRVDPRCALCVHPLILLTNSNSWPAAAGPRRVHPARQAAARLQRGIGDDRHPGELYPFIGRVAGGKLPPKDRRFLPLPT